MSKSELSRRTLLAGAAVAIPATGIIAAALPAAAEDDPIFAAIERHKVAFRLSQVAGRIRGNTVDAEWSPDYDPVACNTALAADEEAIAASDAAAIALITIRPTTMAGVLALLAYVEAFDAAGRADRLALPKSILANTR
jgi:hypothetical protein